MKVEAKPEILQWAAEQSRLPLEELEQRVPQLSAWIRGEAQPTVVQLEHFAHVTHVPFGYLMLSEVPQRHPSKVRDFRTKRNQGIGEYSRNLQDTIRLMKERQAWLHTYKEEEGYAKVAFVGSLRKTLPKHEFLARMREVLSLEPDWQKEVKSKEDAFRFLQAHAEAAGVIVFVNSMVGNDTHRPLDVEEFRGFALADAYAPLIFVNGADAPAGRTFTLMHEMMHLFLGRDGLDDGTETFCNAMAAALLVPAQAFAVMWEEVAGDFDALERQFKVSRLVLYRVAYDQKKISRPQYAAAVAAYQREMKGRKKRGGFADFYRLQANRAGRSFSRYVFSAVQEGRLLYREAYHLLGIRGRTFQSLMQKAMEVA